MEISIDEGRYDRQELISWWDQDLLRASKVLVVGAGALGNEVIKNLVLVGVGQIDVLDMDVVERSNLARCIFFRQSDDGRPKAEVVAEAAASVNPDCTITGHVVNVMSIGLAWLASFDLIIGALDNREARLWVNQACRKLGLTWIDGAIEGIRGVVKVFPPEGACYECTLGEMDREILSRRRSCALLSHEEMLAGKVPTTATSASVIAGLQTQEAVRVLHRLPSPIANRGWIFTGETFDSYVIEYTEDPLCMAHDRYDDLVFESYGDEASISDFLEADARRPGFTPDAIDFEVEIVRSARCLECDWDTDVSCRLDAVSVERVTCPTCGSLGQLDVVLSIGVDDPLVAQPLRSLEMPDDDVVTVRSGQQRVHHALGVAQ